MKRTF